MKQTINKVTQKVMKRLHSENKFYLIDSPWNKSIEEIIELVNNVEDLKPYCKETTGAHFEKTENSSFVHPSGIVYLSRQEYDNKSNSTIIYLLKN